jgi:hypothetical protein
MHWRRIARNRGEFGCELEIESGTRIMKLPG